MRHVQFFSLILNDHIVLTLNSTYVGYEKHCNILFSSNKSGDNGQD